MNQLDSILDIQENLINWFDQNGRHWIPWKLKENGSIPKVGESISPYGIWIAEVMLQQTQLKVVLPYWKKWMIVFPRLNELVHANEQDVLMNWQGLGYYSRAKRILQSSQVLIKTIGQEKSLIPAFWPTTVDQWMGLPGIGRSTAGSIVSSAFDLPTPILDGNVKRIFSRLLAIDNPSNKDQKSFWELSKLLLNCNSPRNLNQALMDLGATVCTPRKPNCLVCPLQNFCLAYIKYDPINFPTKHIKKTMPIQEIGIGLIFNNDGQLLIDQRLESSSMGGMWEFPGGKKNCDESIEETIQREIKEEIGIDINVGNKLLSFEHSYSHKKLLFTVHICQWKSGIPRPLASQKILWVYPDKLFKFPFPAANTKIITSLHSYLNVENKDP
tara:strand:- start:1979 stop:3133 length:1155 start_codon:yes stop_codon:yes gene_type:complete